MFLYFVFLLYRISRVAQSCYSVIGDKPFLWSKPKFDSPNFVLPEPIITKLGTVDYVGNPYWDANFS